MSSGRFRLNLTIPVADAATGVINRTTYATSCIDFDASEDDVRDALEALVPIGSGDVAVERSGTGGASSEFGYSWSIEFTGLIGVIPRLEAALCEPAPGVLGGGSANVTVSALPDRYKLRGLATSTEIVTLTVSATARIVQGQFRLTVGRNDSSAVYETSCLHWDDSSEVVEDAVERLPNVDSVRVVRHGDGGFASNYGHTYEIFFDGYAMQALESSAAHVEVNATIERCSVVFATEVFGVLEPFRQDDFDYSLTVNVSAIGGADIGATGRLCRELTVSCARARTYARHL